MISKESRRRSHKKVAKVFDGAANFRQNHHAIKFSFQKGRSMKAMKRNTVVCDAPLNIFSKQLRLTRTTKYQLEGKPVDKVRLGRICLYFVGSYLEGISYVWGTPQDTDKTPLNIEQWMRDTYMGRKLATLLEEKEEVFMGDKWNFVNSSMDFQMHFWRILSTEGSTYIHMKVEETLNVKDSE